MPEDVHERLIQERGAEYGESYAVTDRWIKENLDYLSQAPNAFVLIMLHNKLTRALTSPSKQDHYDDIIGYAKLALRTLKESKRQQPAIHWVIDNDELEQLQTLKDGIEG